MYHFVKHGTNANQFGEGQGSSAKYQVSGARGEGAEGGGRKAVASTITIAATPDAK